jgi:FtsH-binding integral membrane protein
MISRIAYKPAAFFLITILFTSVFEFIAAWLSFQKGWEERYVPIMFIAIFMPFATALFMHFRAKNPELWRDYWDKLVNLRRTSSL